MAGQGSRLPAAAFSCWPAQASKHKFVTGNAPSNARPACIAFDHVANSSPKCMLLSNSLLPSPHSQRPRSSFSAQQPPVLGLFWGASAPAGLVVKMLNGHLKLLSSLPSFLYSYKVQCFRCTSLLNASLRSAGVCTGWLSLAGHWSRLMRAAFGWAAVAHAGEQRYVCGRVGTLRSRACLPCLC